MKTDHFDVIVIGAGLVGLSTAYQLKLKVPKQRILILEKESDVAAHQSGHNSGVMHSGIYYKPGSLKATNCIQGYKDLIRFAETHDIKHERCGKIIVATSKKELPLLNQLFDRGRQHGLENLRLLSAEEIKEFEPHCAGFQAVHVPQAGIIDYMQLAGKLLTLFMDIYDGKVMFREEVVAIDRHGENNIVTTKNHRISCSHVINCAGLQSDRVTKLTEYENDLLIIPFRGEYYELKPERSHLVRNLIYPVPDPEFPFLGVHFTRMIKGGIEAGPNAVLAFKREGYRRNDFNLSDTFDTLTWPGFWKIAGKYGATGLGEVYRSLFKTAFTKALQKLIPEINPADLIKGGTGVRAQACDRNGKLIDDFDILRNKRIVHVRNAPSPAATSCLAIGKYICDQMQIT